MANGFVDKDLNPTEMPNVVAAPVNTYVRPPESQAQQFVSGLGALIPKVARLADTFDKEDGDQAEAEAKMRALKATPQELRKEIEGGNYFGMAHKRAQTALSVMDAQNRAFEVAADVDAMHERGELNSADARGQLAGKVTGITETLSHDPLAVKAFAQGVTPVMQKAELQLQRNMISTAEKDKESRLFEYMTGLHNQVDRDSLEHGDTSEASVAAHKNAIYRTADFAKKDLLMQPQAIEAVLGKVAQHYAQQGNIAALSALGGYSRDGGATLSAKYGPQWDTWQKHAEAMQDHTRKKAVHSSVDSLEAQAIRTNIKPEEYDEQVDAARARDPANFDEAKAEHLKLTFRHNLEARAKAATKALSAQQKDHVERDFIEKGAQALATGDGYLLPPEARFKTADNKEHTFKSKDYEERMYQRAQALIDAQAQDNGWDANEVAARKLRLYGQNGDVHPVYQAGFNDLYASSRAGASIAPEKLQGRLAQLEMLRQNDPSQFYNLTKKHATPGKLSEQELWLHTYKTARDYGSDPETAYATANQRTFNPDIMGRMQPQKLDDAISTVMKKLGTSGPLGHAAAADTVRLMLAAGVPLGDVPAKAVEKFNATHFVVNGVPVSNQIPGVATAAAANEYLTDAAAFFKGSNPALKKQTYDVAFTDDPAQPGKYIAVRTDTMERISREGISGERLKDYVLQWRERVRQNPESNPAPGYVQRFRQTGKDLGKLIKKGILKQPTE